MAHSNQTQQWIGEARGGDRAAVSKLLAVHHPFLRARVSARMDPALRARAEPEDILQQAYLEVFRHIGTFEDHGPDSFLNWVLTILDHKILDAQRALHRKKRDIAREQGPPAASVADSCFNLLDQLWAHSRTPSRVVRRDEAVDALLAGISHLSEAHRQVVQLRFLEGRSVKEAAEQLGKSEGAVVKLTERALAELRKQMDGMGEFTQLL